MARGRKPEAAEIKQAKGNPGRRPIKATSADVPGLSIKPPAMLTHAGPKKVWERLVPNLDKMKLLRSTDIEALARYCQHVFDFWDMTKELRKDGRTYVTESNHGTMKRVNPVYLVRDRTERMMMSLEDRLGLSPRSRQELIQKLSQDAAAAASARDGLDPHRPSEAIDPDSPLGLLGRKGHDAPPVH